MSAAIATGKCGWRLHTLPRRPVLEGYKTKFEHDFAGVATNGAHGFAFFVNQPMTIGERELLQAKAGAVPVEIYHLERIRSLLDSPKG